MIFRNPDHTETQEDIRIAEILESARDFAQKIAPEDSRIKIDQIYNDLSVVLCKNRVFKCIHNGHLVDTEFSSVRGGIPAGAVMFWDNFDSKKCTSNLGIAIFPTSGAHIITHEALHAFSSDIGKTKNGGEFMKVGSKYTECDDKGDIIVKTSVDLNESITDALASRSQGHIGPSSGAGYAQQLIMADLLMGEKVENNFFIQDVYFGRGEKFAADFDKTVKTSKVKFAGYLQDFRVLGSEEENQKSDELLKGAVEYNLRKAQTAEEIDKVYAFQQRVINLYKDGGITTNFMEDEDIARMENLLKFADKMQKQCKSNLVAQRMAAQQKVKGA